MKARSAFPERGRPRGDIAAALAEMREADADWRGGRVPLYVFGALPEVEEVGREAFMTFFSENALGARRAFKSLGRMEEEIVDMALGLFHAPADGAGVVTSGGTESILLAVKACRDFARARRGERFLHGNLVLPETAHPAFDKAALLMDLEVRRIPVAGDLRADIAAMANAVDTETSMIAGSVPCFPYGVIDPIAELSELALSRGLWLHVDACVGGYLAPFARDLGRPIPEFDFALPGVAALSADLHKFGFCPKPASTILFRDTTRANAGGFDLDVWPSGRFTTRTLVGTRPGGSVAAAWAVLNHLGREGYRAIAARLIAMRDAYVAGIEAIPGMRVFGRPELTIIAFGAEALDMAAVAEDMAARGWVPGLVRRPPGLHIMASLLHEGVRDRYLGDLAAAVAAAPPASATGVAADY
ncbi:MAG: aspartate aminotransferase family protein [Rhodospirillales bacterium]|nr:aspartate aminotransferase family protein [Rhodospirillales bacterium]